jgi:hypothetical protein
MLILGDIQHLRNTYYVSQHQQFTQDLSMNVIRIEKPVVYMESPHSCYSHMIEDIFRCFWTIQDLIENKYIENEDVILFIGKDGFVEYPKQTAQVFDSSSKSYKGAWQKLLNVLTKEPLILEHFLEKDVIYYFSNVFILEKQDMWQHSYWNSFLYYVGREIPDTYKYQHLLQYGIVKDGQVVSRVRFNDDTIQKHLLAFRSKVFQHYLGDTLVPKCEQRRAIILDRKDDRTFPPHYRKEIEDFCTQSPTIDFQGVHYAEEKSFEEQVKLFYTNDIFFIIHGSGLSNILWARPNSTLVDFDRYDNRFIVFHRLCSFLGIKKHSVLLLPNGTLGDVLKSITDL